jgi:hypothetical protein
MMETIGAVLDRIEKRANPEAIEISPNGISLDLLRAVYRNSSLPLQVRIRAAGLALLHEVPKLAVTAVVSERDFASLLDQRLKRIEEMRLIEAQPSINNGNGPEVEIKPPLPRVPDKRFRRI